MSRYVTVAEHRARDEEGRRQWLARLEAERDTGMLRGFPRPVPEVAPRPPQREAPRWPLGGPWLPPPSPPTPDTSATQDAHATARTHGFLLGRLRDADVWARPGAAYGGGL